MAIFSELSAIILPVFICAGIGLFWSRTDQKFESDLVSTLVYKIAVPCLIIAIFAKVHLTPDAVAAVAGAALVIYLLTAAAAASVLRLVRLPMPSYLPSLIFPMVGSMGLPICLFAFGEDGLALALVFFTLGAIGTFTIGAAIAAGSVSWSKLISEPAIWAALLCLETLEEIAMQNSDLFAASGGGSLHYIPSLNARDDHVAFLCRLVEKHVSGWPESSTDWSASEDAREHDRSRQRALAMGAAQ